MKRRTLVAVTSALGCLAGAAGATLLVTATASAASLVSPVIVQPGDTLSGIAARVGTTWQSLAKLNHLTDPNLIFPNQVIQISSTGASPTVAVARDSDGDFDGNAPDSDDWATPGSDPAPVAPASAPVAAAPAPAPAAPAPAPVASSSDTGGGIWSCIANHESGGNPAENTGNGFYGAFQFTASTWDSLNTGYARADLAPYSVQLQAAQQLQARSGWGQWPNTSAMCGA